MHGKWRGPGRTSSIPCSEKDRGFSTSSAARLTRTFPPLALSVPSEFGEREPLVVSPAES